MLLIFKILQFSSYFKKFFESFSKFFSTFSVTFDPYRKKISRFLESAEHEKSLF